jgi:Periplasmic component of the Tol biopolymer transport system
LMQLRPQIPPGLAAVIMRCVEKRPADRWQSAEELHAALEPYAMTSGATALTQSALSATKAPFRWTSQRIAVTAGILGIVVTALVASTIAFRRNDQALIVGNTRQVTNAAGIELLPQISPDGKFVAYTAPKGTAYALYVKQIAGGRPILLADTGALATWKPDGSEILYSQVGGHSFTVPALGGVPTSVPALDGLQGCMYSNAGDRLACSDMTTGALVISGAKGENRRVVPETASGDGVMLPTWSPDDKLIAFSRGNTPFFIGTSIGNIAPSSVWLVRADGGKPVRITEDTHLNVSPVWTPDGDVLFVSSLGGTRDIYLQRKNGDLSPRGQPIRLTTGLNAHTISIDRAGTTLAYSVFNTVANVWASPISSSDTENPRLTQVTTGNQTIESGSVSPDKKWLAFDSNINGNQDIFKMPIGGGEPQQLTHNHVDNFAPAWSPDGTQLAFHSLLNGNRDIFVMDASGGNLIPAVASPSEEANANWRPDGKGIVYRVFPDSIYEVDRDVASHSGWGKPRYRERIQRSVGFSPDGTRILVGADEDVLCAGCTKGAYLMSSEWTNPQLIPLKEIPKVTEVAGQIVWSRDGKHAYLWLRERDGTSSIWQMPINGDKEKRVLHLTDPGRQLYDFFLDVDDTDFYFNIGDRQSDVWSMELKKR